MRITAQGAQHAAGQRCLEKTTGWLAWLCAAMLGAGFLLIYASMLSDQPTRANYGGDGGDFVAAMLTGGIPHPTGYPLFTIVGRLFLRLPFSTPYGRVALLSAVAGALAVALAFRWVWSAAGGSRSSTGAWLAALAAALAWGSAPLFWSQAVIVEVHTLQAVFVLAWLGWLSELLARNQTWQCTGCLLGYAILAGFSVGNHMTILLLLPALGISQYLALRRGMPLRLALVQGAGFIAAASLIYLYLPWQARGWPPINWGNPQNLAGLWWLVSGTPYRGLVFGVQGVELIRQAADWARQLVFQFSLPGVLLGLLGLVKAPGWRLDTRLLLIWLFGVFSIFSVGYSTRDAQVYLLPAYLAFASWLGQGLALIWPLAWRGWPVGRALGLVVLFVLVGRMFVTRAAVDPRVSTEQADFARALLSQAPAGAILVTLGDADSFPVWYEHFGLGQRPDVRVVVQPLTQFRWYQETLRKTYPDLAMPPFEQRSDDGWADELVALNPERPVCWSYKDLLLPAQVGFTCQAVP